MKYLSLTVLTIFLIFSGVFILSLRAETVSEGEHILNEALSKRILQAWNSDYERTETVEFTFKLTEAGDPYDICIARGCEDPFTIKAGVRAILFAGSLADFRSSSMGETFVRCSIRAGKAKPAIKIITKKFSPESKSSDFRLENTLTGDYPYEELTWLCSELFDFPDDSRLLKIAEDHFNSIGLTGKSEHDWISLARHLRGRISYSDTGTVDNRKMQAEIGALFQGYLVNRNQEILHELSDAYSRKIGMEIQHLGREPLLLGSAEILCGHYNIAFSLLSDVKDKDERSRHLLNRIHSSKTLELRTKEPLLGEDFAPKRTNLDWNCLLKWLPVDTELVLVGHLNGLKSTDKLTSLNLFFDPLPESQGNEIDELFRGVEISTAMHAARNFDFSFKSEGTGCVNFPQYIDILVFSDSSSSDAAQVFNKARRDCVFRQEIEGFEVLSFKNAPWSFRMFRKNDATQACCPIPGVLLTSNNQEFLRQTLLRLRTQPSDRALAETLPEWKEIDTTARLWGLRHYDKSFLPFLSPYLYNTGSEYPSEAANSLLSQRKRSRLLRKTFREAVGFLFYIDGQKMMIKSLATKSSVLKAQIEGWKESITQRSADTGRILSAKANVKLEDGMLTAEGTVNERSTVVMDLLLNLGYMVAL